MIDCLKSVCDLNVAAARGQPFRGRPQAGRGPWRPTTEGIPKLTSPGEQPWRPTKNHEKIKTSENLESINHPYFCVENVYQKHTKNIRKTYEKHKKSKGTT